MQSNDTCEKAATNLLAELDQEYKYAKFHLDDLFSVNYDIFDTVKLKATLPTKVINENLKIYSIETEVSASSESLYESVTIELANFRRGVWADLVNPLDAAKANNSTINFSGISTQAQEQVSLTKIEETITSYAATFEIIDDWEDLDSVTFDDRDTSGAQFIVDISIIPDNKIDAPVSIIFFRLFDGVDAFPTPDIPTTYIPIIGKEQPKQLAIFVPNNTKNKTLTLQAKVASGGRVDLGTFITAYSVAL